MLVKVCGLKSQEEAKRAAKLGANYIGLVFHPPSYRYVTLSLAKEVALGAKEGGAIPVGVFVDHDASTIQAICKEVGLQVVQLHGKRSKEALATLREIYEVIFVFSVDERGKIDSEDLSLFKRTGEQAHYLLFDAKTPGRGRPFNWEAFSCPYPNAPWFLAGGITPKNLKTALSFQSPRGIDISSGVERELGKKDTTLMQTLFKEVIE